MKSTSVAANQQVELENIWLKVLKKWSLLLFTIVVYVVFALLEPAFFSLENFFVILRQGTITGLLALGLTFVIIAGEFDLSFAATATFGGVAGIMLFDSGMNVLLGLLIVIAIGVAIGLLDSFLILKLRIPAFVATLGVMGLLTGMTRLLTGGTTFFPFYIPPSITFLGRGFYLGVPFQVFVLLGITLISVFFLEHHYVGRHLYATGGNRIAAMHVGINTTRIKVLAFVMCQLFAVIGGIIATSMLGAGNAEVATGHQMPAISAAYMGGVFLKGGLPNPWGTFIASILMAMLANGFVMLGFSQSIKEIVQGLILLLAVSLVTASRKGAQSGV